MDAEKAAHAALAKEKKAEVKAASRTGVRSHSGQPAPTVMKGNATLRQLPHRPRRK